MSELAGRARPTDDHRREPMATLSLRLWAQPHAEKKLGHCVLLDRSPGAVIAVDESGIVAVVLEAGTATETNIAPGSPPEPWPTLTLTRMPTGSSSFGTVLTTA